MSVNDMARQAVYNQQKEAGNKILEKVAAAKFTGVKQLLVKLLAEDRGLYRFEILSEDDKGSFLWVPATSIEWLREMSEQEIEKLDAEKQQWFVV